MKKLFLIPLLVAGVVYAGSSKQATRAYSSVTTEPSSATDGIPGEEQGKPLTGITITGYQPYDGGAESQDIEDVSFLGWKMTKGGVGWDGGGAHWTRAPQLDKAMTQGDDLYTTTNHGLTAYVAKADIPDMAAGARIMYTVSNIVLVDGGTGYLNLIVEGTYR